MSQPPGSQKIRVLFASIGWPCGVLEVGSWASWLGLADVAIVPLGVEGSRGGPPVAGPTKRRAWRVLGEPFARKLLQWRPHLVGFRIEGGQFERVRRSICAVRTLLDTEIVLGGPTATSHPREVFDDCQADYVFRGEAEETFAQFLRLARRANSKDIQADIPGLVYRHAGRIQVNTLPTDGHGPSRLERPILSTDRLRAGRLDWSLLEGFDRVEPMESLHFTGGRGCPGSCMFCAKLHGRRVRVKSAEQVLEEIVSADEAVRAGRLRVGRWPLFAYVDDPGLRPLKVAWASIYDEDFLLDVGRAIRFFELWSEHPVRARYRLSFQTNPRSMVGTTDGRVHPELIAWIRRVQPMVQLGAESFHAELLDRWHKRHDLGELDRVLDALETTGADYTVFQLLTDFDSTPEEVIESVRLLALGALARPHIRIAASPFTIPLFDSDTRGWLEHTGRLDGRITHFTDYERPHPEWMAPLAAELADAADAELQWALYPERRDVALIGGVRAMVDWLASRTAGGCEALLEQAQRALVEVKRAAGG